jgi:hypothetical protein
MSVNTEQKFSASIIIHQEGKKELAARMEVETYRVFSIDSTRFRRKRKRGTRTNFGHIYLFSKCLMH